MIDPAAPQPAPPSAAPAPEPRRRKGRWAARLIIGLFVVFVLAPSAWVGAYRFVEAPGTLLMAQRALEGQDVRRAPIPLADMSPHLVTAVIAAEDNNFCAHRGFDWEALEAAQEYNQRMAEEGRAARRGASTISQQTAKNLFLWPDRSMVRKAAEAYFTLLMEAFWPKRRIMEAYLNAAEFGEGHFGVEAAARAYFDRPASALTRTQAARLAAVLPSPNRWSAAEPGPYVRRRTRQLLARMQDVTAEGRAACVLDVRMSR